MSSQEQDFAEIIRILKQISEKLDKPCGCGPKDGTQYFPTPFPNPVVGPSCPVCRMSNGLNGYVCMRADCPTAIHANPFQNMTGGNVSYTNTNVVFVTGMTVANT